MDIEQVAGYDDPLVKQEVEAYRIAEAFYNAMRDVFEAAVAAFAPVVEAMQAFWSALVAVYFVVAARWALAVYRARNAVAAVRRRRWRIKASMAGP